MNYYFPEQGNYPQYANGLSGNALELHFVIEMLKSENNNLKNLINNQANEIQNKSMTDETQLVNFKNDVASMIKELKTNFDTKFNTIKNQQQKEIGLIIDIWKQNNLMTLLNIKRLLTEEKCTQTDLEEDIQPKEILNDYQTDLQSEKISNKHLQIEMETQPEEMSNDYPQRFEKMSNECLQIEMETQPEEILNDYLPSQMNPQPEKIEYLQIKMETQPDENSKECFQKSTDPQPEEISKDYLASQIVSRTDLRFQGNLNNYSQSQITISSNVMNLASYPENEREKEISSLKSTEDYHPEKREKIIIIMYSCKICDKKFNSKKKMLTHTRMYHETKQCHNCLKDFASGYIGRHKRYHCKKARYSL